MKKNRFNLMLIVAAVAFSACSNDNVEPLEGNGDVPVLPKEMATVNFEMNAASFKAVPQSKAGQIYDDINSLRILAFRQSGDDYLYIGDVKKDEITHNGTAFAGKAQLPVGTYRFIPAYGLPDATNEHLSISDLTFTTPYSDALMVSHKKDGILPAIFLQKEDVVVNDYVLGTDSKVANTTVALEMTRAIARVDIQFVQGDKTSGKYVEKAGSVFGTKTDLASLTLNFAALNPSVQMTNGKLISENITPVNTLFNVNLATARTNGNATATIYGKAKADGKAYDYEAVAPEDFINGSTHIYGPFLIPFADETNYGSDLTLTLTSTPDSENGQTYTRTIHVDKVPLSRNKVTLITIYSGGDDIFHTSSDFEITINKAWEDHKDISGSVE